MIAPAPGRPNPFPGLRPFHEGEAHLFFGRESQVDAMVNRLNATRFLAVVGTSGSGKSSLVNCGLRPALQRGLMASAGHAWRIAQFRPGSDPIRSLAQALAAEGVLYSGHKEDIPIDEIMETYLHQSANGVIEAFQKARLPQGTNLLIVADQFEELFRYSKLETADGKASYTATESAIAFVNLLLKAHTEPNCPIFVVITMRSDFLGDCSQFYGLPEAINEAQYLVPRMTRDERRASIAGPVRVGGAELNPVLLTRLVNDVGDNPDQLSILQHALNRTWACWESHGAAGMLELDHYTEIGTMSEALNQHANEAFQLLETPQRQRICEKLFKALTDLGTDSRGIRRPLKLAALTEIAAAGNGEEVKAVIEVFRDPSRAFLMPPAGEPLEPERVVDISHESLMRVWKQLRLWAEEESDSARRYRRLAETAALEKSGKAGLWRDPDLQLTLDWKEEREPTRPWASLYGGDFESAIDFLGRSQASRDLELAEVVFQRRWRRIRPLVIGIPFILLLIAGVLLWRFEDLKWWSDIWGADKDFVGPVEPTPAPVESAQQVLVQKLPDLEENVEFWKVLKLLGALAFFLGPYFLAFFALNYAGKWLFRRFAFQKILREVALSSTKAAREQKALRALNDLAARLQTTYANGWRRMGAYVLDLALFLPGAVGLFVGFLYLDEVLPRFLHSYFYLLVILSWVIAHWLYDVIMISSRLQATLGMLALGIFAIDHEGNRLRFGRATARHFAKFLCYGSLGIGFLIQPFTSQGQTLSDLISRSVVLVRPHRQKFPWWIMLICLVVAAAEALPVTYVLAFLLAVVSSFLKSG